MRIFNFFKRKAPIEVAKKLEEERISSSSLKFWAETKTKSLKLKEKEVHTEIYGYIGSFSKEIKEKIVPARNFDVNLRKEGEKIKSAVEDGRKKYLGSVEVLVNSLNDMKNENLEKTIHETERIFLDFNKRSRMGYERATILIGKEMVELRKSINEFFKILIKTFDEKKDLLEQFRGISLIQLKMDQIEKIEQDIQKKEKEISLFEKKIIESEKENGTLISEIDSIKKSEEYAERQKNQEKINLLKIEMEKEILSLQKLIDFKALGRFYHIFGNEMQKVNAHRDDFQSAFKKDFGKGIINLLENAKLNSEEISNKLNQIKIKREKFMEIENNLEEDKIKDLIYSSEKIVQNINELNQEKIRLEKEFKKFELDKEGLINELKKSLELFEVELEL